MNSNAATFLHSIQSLESNGYREMSQRRRVSAQVASGESKSETGCTMTNKFSRHRELKAMAAVTRLVLEYQPFHRGLESLRRVLGAGGELLGLLGGALTLGWTARTNNQVNLPSQQSVSFSVPSPRMTECRL